VRYLYLLLALICNSALAETTVRYIANAGLLIDSGDSKVLFDPLFDSDYGQYYLPPAKVRSAILSGTAPFDEIDAVFISHAHADHFSASDMLTMLRKQTRVRLYGSDQVIDALKSAANGGYIEVFDRATRVTLARGDRPLTFTQGSIDIEVTNIPHSGWPARFTDVANLAFRVTLTDGTTVLHMGDADARDEHYALQGDHWTSRIIDAAFPPYWYFLSPAGRQILDERLKPLESFGVHVPRKIPRSPQDRRHGLQDVDLFTTPGETRQISRD
jgi:L-ascorbate metabolism protein UlaG (beta-lactamase superfamily)